MPHRKPGPAPPTGTLKTTVHQIYQIRDSAKEGLDLCYLVSLGAVVSAPIPGIAYARTQRRITAFRGNNLGTSVKRVYIGLAGPASWTSNHPTKPGPPGSPPRLPRKGEVDCRPNPRHAMGQRKQKHPDLSAGAWNGQTHQSRFESGVFSSPQRRANMPGRETSSGLWKQRYF